MKTSVTLLWAASAWSIGCATASGPHFLSDEVSLSRTSKAYVDVGTVRSDQLLPTLSPVLARFGYFITDTKRVAGGLHLLTDWRARPLTEEELFQGLQQARTRLVVDARQRGDRYAVTLYAVGFVEDAQGVWRPITVTGDLRKHMQMIGTQLAADTRMSVSAARPAGRP